MMIEPPGQPGRRAVFEIEDCVFVAVEQLFFDQLLIRPVSQASVSDLGFRPDLGGEESREDGSGCEAVEAMIVMQDSEFHYVEGPFSLAQKQVNQFTIRERES